MVWGLLAAVGWGSADVLAAVSGRQMGWMRTALVVLGTSLALIAGVALITGHAAPPPWEALRFVIGSGVLAGCAYLSLYRALELGPVAVVSPVVSAFAAITVVLSVVFAHEQVRPLSIAGMVATFAGVALASSDPHKLREHGLKHLRGGGVPWAIAALVSFGVATFFLGEGSQRTSAITAAAYGRLFNVVVVVIVTIIMRRKFRATPAPKPFRPWAAVATGFVDIGGTLSFAAGSALGSVAIVTAASSALVIPPVIGGLLLFHERPAKLQYIGIAAVGLGLLLLGLGS